MVEFPWTRHVDRRRFLLGVGEATVVGAFLAACGRSGPTGSGGSVPENLVIVQRLPSSTLSPGTVRIPFSLGGLTGTGADAQLEVLDHDAANALPDELRVSLKNMDTGAPVVSGVVVRRHGAEFPTPYWPLVVDIDAPGIFSLTLDDYAAEPAAVQVLERSLVPIPQVGDPLPGYPTPTVDDPRGVDPICTRAAGICPFHDVDLAAALTTGKPVVYLIGTPAYCQTGVCAPSLDAVIDIAARVDGAATFVHADVYTDSTATAIAPALEFYKMSFEPALFVTDGDGVLRSRLDVVFDADEISAALAAVGVS